MTQLPDTTTEAGQREASVILARLMGLAPQLFSDICNFYHEETYDVFVVAYPHGWYHGMTEDEAWKYFPNLYDPANMALALGCIRWGMENSADFDELVTTNAYRILRSETGINDALNELLKAYAVVAIV